MRVRCRPTGRRNVRTCRWSMATQFITPANSSRLPRRSQPSMVEVNANQRTRQRGCGLQVRLVSTNDRLPNLSMLHRSNPAARPRRGLPSCPLRLQLHMRRLILLWHLSLLCRLAQGQRMWLCGSERIVRLLCQSCKCNAFVHEDGHSETCVEGPNPTPRFVPFDGVWFAEF